MKTDCKVGDRVWVASYTHGAVRVVCPICFGKRRVTLIRGDDSVVELLCGFCGIGEPGPTGYVTEHEYSAMAYQVAITAVATRVESTGTKIEYHVGTDGCYTTYHPENCFATEAEALERGKELGEIAQGKAETHAGYGKADAEKSYAWNAGYHLREAKKARERVAYHEKMAVVCKGKTKGGKHEADV